MASASLRPAQMEWLGHFDALAADEQKSLLDRYRLLDVAAAKARRNRGRTWQGPDRALAITTVR